MNDIAADSLILPELMENSYNTAQKVSIEDHPDDFDQLKNGVNSP